MILGPRRVYRNQDAAMKIKSAQKTHIETHFLREIERKKKNRAQNFIQKGKTRKRKQKKRWNVNPDKKS